jgi:hypothetical protein
MGFWLRWVDVAKKAGRRMACPWETAAPNHPATKTENKGTVSVSVTQPRPPYPCRVQAIRERRPSLIPRGSKARPPLGLSEENPAPVRSPGGLGADGGRERSRTRWGCQFTVSGSGIGTVGAASWGHSWLVVHKARRRKTRLVDSSLCVVAATSESSPSSRFSKDSIRADINILRPSLVIFCPLPFVWRYFSVWRDFPRIDVGQ